MRIHYVICLLLLIFSCAGNKKQTIEGELFDDELNEELGVDISKEDEQNSLESADSNKSENSHKIQSEEELDELEDIDDDIETQKDKPRDSVASDEQLEDPNDDKEISDDAPKDPVASDEQLTELEQIEELEEENLQKRAKSTKKVKKLKKGAFSNKVQIVDNSKDQNVLKISQYALIKSAKISTVESLKHLLTKGIDINFKNRKGNTALIEAIRYDRTENAKFLILKGADTSIKNKSGLSALDVAKNKNNSVIINLLER